MQEGYLIFRFVYYELSVSTSDDASIFSLRNLQDIELFDELAIYQSLAMHNALNITFSYQFVVVIPIRSKKIGDISTRKDTYYISKSSCVWEPS